VPPDNRDERRFEIRAGPAASPARSPEGGPAEPALFEGARLDAARAAPEPDRPNAPDRRRYAPWGLLGSLAVHLSPLLLLLSFAGPAAEIPQPIPVQLVLEPPPPPEPPAPPAPPVPPPKPALGRIASVEMGETDPQPQPEAKAPPPPPAETQVAMAAPPPPKPTPPPELASALPKPLADPSALALPHEDAPQSPPPAPPSPPKPAVKQAAVARPPGPKPVQPQRVPGPEATRDEYLAYCERMIRRYIDMVSPAFLAGRSGVAVLSIVVLADGTISRVAVKQSSGYPDIDLRAEQMISAVRRFPPLPQWIQSSTLPVSFHLAFRNGAVY